MSQAERGTAGSGGSGPVRARTGTVGVALTTGMRVDWERTVMRRALLIATVMARGDEARRGGGVKRRGSGAWATRNGTAADGR